MVTELPSSERRKVPAGSELPSAERRPLTIMFCDIVGSTRLADTLLPEEFQIVLDDFHDICTEQFDRFGGHIADRPGDGILAYFGFPRALEDDADRALNCALALQNAIALASSVPGVEIRIRVGIASGRIVMANMRRAHHGRRAVAVGRYVHLASRLQSLAEASQIVLDENTRNLVGGAFEFIDLGEQPLRGFSQPEQVWRLLNAEASVNRFTAQRGYRLLPLVGRHDELNLLQQTFRDAQCGRGRTLVISGESGHGKSRLVYEFEKQLRDTDCFFFSYQCSAHFSGTALYPLISHLESGSGIESTDSVSIRRDKLRAYLQPRSPVDEQFLALISDRLNILEPGVGSGIDGMSARRKMELLTDGLNHRTLALASHKPVLIMIEDAHWMDPSSLAAVSQLIDRITDQRVMLVMTVRPPLDDAVHQLSGVEIMPLQPLSPVELRSMISFAADGRSIPQQVMDRIVNNTEGVPLFVEEVTRDVLDSSSLRQQGDSFVLTGAMPELEVPDNIEKSLLARLDGAGTARSTVQVAAVLGRDFTEELLFDVVDLTADELASHIETLIAAGILVNFADRSGRQFGFRHALLQEVAYASITRTRVEQLHNRIATALEQNWPGLVAQRPELLALHYSRANKPASAVEYWHRAALQARRLWANEEAISWLTRGLEELARVPVTDAVARHRLDMQLELADVLRAQRGTSAPETRSAYRQAKSLCQSIGEVLPLSRALYGEFVTAFNTANLTVTETVSDELLQLGEESGHCETVRCARQALGMHSFVTGKFDHARSQLELALAADSIDYGNNIDEQFPGNSLSYLAWSLYMLGSETQALATMQKAIDAARDNEPNRYALALANACYLHQFRRDREAVVATADALAVVADEHALASWSCVAEFFSCWAGCEQHSKLSSVQLFERKLDYWADDEIEIPYFTALVAGAWLQLANLPRARQHIDKAVALAESTGEVWYLAEILRLQSLILSAQGDAAAATACQQRARYVAIGQGAQSWLQRQWAGKQ